MVIAKALKGSSAVDAAGLAKALNSGKTINIGPSLPTLHSTFPGPIKGSPRVINAEAIDFKISGGKMTSLGGFYNPYAG
jgi:hypothetical protein